MHQNSPVPWSWRLSEIFSSEANPEKTRGYAMRPEFNPGFFNDRVIFCRVHLTYSQPV
jgi:uncharacterized protein YktB (UPF0637 family)